MPLFNNRIASPLVGEAEFQHEERVLEIQVRGSLRTSCIFRPLTRICSSLRSHNCGLSLKGRGYSYVGSLYSSRGEGVLGILLRRQYDYYVASLTRRPAENPPRNDRPKLNVLPCLRHPRNDILLSGANPRHVLST